MEYPERRRVYVDGEPCGWTNRIIKADAGTHEIHLDQPTDHLPARVVLTLTDTTWNAPEAVTFRPAPAP